MQFDVSGAWADVSGTAAELGWLDEYTSCDVVRFTRSRGRISREVTKFRMLDTGSMRLPAGLVPMVHKAVEHGSAYSSWPITSWGIADTKWLRDYQAHVVGKFAGSVPPRGIVKVATAGGKSEIAIAIMRIFQRRWLFLSHRLDLVRQFQERFDLRGGAPGSTLTCMTLQAARAALKRDPDALAGFDAVCMDEVHAAGADTYWDVLMACPADVRLGLSATPLDRGDMDALMTIGAIGPIVADVPAKVLCDAGVCGLPDITMVVCEQRGNQRTWAKAYRELVVESQVRNAVIVDMVHRAAKPCLVFVDHTKHGRILLDALRRSGLRADFAHGQHRSDQRVAKLKDLAGDRADVLICTVIFQEGVDVPELESAVIACGKSSTVATLQRVGRVMRVKQGKTSFEVWDVMDKGQRWLAEHAKKRCKAYRREQYPVRIVEKVA